MNLQNMGERHVLVAYIATLAAIVILVIAGAILAAYGKSTEALGIGGAVTGLIGVLGTFKPRNAGNAISGAETSDNGTGA